MNLPNNEFAEYVRLLQNTYEPTQKETPAVSILFGDFNAKSRLFSADFNSNKATGYGGISVTMIKLCATAVAIPLQNM